MSENMMNDEPHEYYEDPREARWQARPLQPARPKTKRGFWEEVFAFSSKTEHPEVTKARTRIAWRITRFLAVVQGRIASDQRLSDLNPEEHDTCKELCEQAKAYAPKHMLDALQAALPLVSPKPNYFLSYDENLSIEQHYLLFHAAVRKLKKYLGSPIGPKDPFTGSEDWYGILDQSRCFQVYPDISEIQLFEERLVDRILKAHVQQGQLAAHKYLRYTLALSDNEARCITALARKTAQQHFDGLGQEEERSIMTLRLQDFQQRAQRALNLREELQGLKQEALVRGLTKTQPETFMDVFAQVVQKTSQEAPRQIEEAREQQSEE